MKNTKQTLIMSPILGVTSYVYRNAYTSVFTGFAEAVTPFISMCAARRLTSNYLRDVAPKNNSARFKIIPQVIGNKANEFISVAKALDDLGYEEVNWNLGCPHKRIRDKKRGSGLIAHPDLVCSILDEVLKEIPNEVSIKLRLGGEKTTELGELLPRLDQYPLKRIMVHPRTGAQLYKGKVDLDAFEACLSMTKHEVVYNGDINSFESFNELSVRFKGVNQWMIGRGAIVNPFLPEMIMTKNDGNISLLEKRFKSFHHKLFSNYRKSLCGPGHLMDKMKAIWLYWQEMFVDGKQLHRKICRCRDINSYEKVVQNIFSKENFIKLDYLIKKNSS